MPKKVSAQRLRRLISGLKRRVKKYGSWGDEVRKFIKDNQDVQGFAKSSNVVLSDYDRKRGKIKLREVPNIEKEGKTRLPRYRRKSC